MRKKGRACDCIFPLVLKGDPSLLDMLSQISPRKRQRQMQDRSVSSRGPAASSCAPAAACDFEPRPQGRVWRERPQTLHLYV